MHSTVTTDRQKIRSTFDGPFVLVWIEPRNGINARLYRRCIQTVVIVVCRFGSLAGLRLLWLLLLLLLLNRRFDVVISGRRGTGAVRSGCRVRTHTLFPLDRISELLIQLGNDFDLDEDCEVLGVGRFCDVASTDAQDRVVGKPPVFNLFVVGAVQHCAGEREDYGL